VFAFAYNAIGIPIAAGVLYPAFGILAQPDDRGAGDVVQLRIRDRERAAVAQHASLAQANRSAHRPLY
jgi:hypothetical protein